MVSIGKRSLLGHLSDVHNVTFADPVVLKGGTVSTPLATHHIDALLPINDYKSDGIFVSSFSVFISLPFAPMSCWQLLRYTGELASSACAS